MTEWFADIVLVETTSTGTGNLTTTAVTGYQDFNDVWGTGAAAEFFYHIRHKSAAEWEYGQGHLSAATTFVRDRVIRSSNSDAAVDFSAGTKVIVNDWSAQHANASFGITGPTLIANHYHSRGDQVLTLPVALVADFLYTVPLFCSEPDSFTILAAHVTTAVGGTNIRMGLWEALSTGLPGALVAESASLSSASTGKKETVGLTINLLPGTYWMGVVSDGAPTVDWALTGLNFYILGSVDPTLATHGNVLFKAHTFGAMPDPFGTPAYAEVTRYCPLLWLST